ncbi:hypothetical protein HDU67_007590 [Dinochytrium kinnereticum]|nr:hypothetical protein HDU67_007590 [Dinochytrium kinnereticum]
MQDEDGGVREERPPLAIETRRGDDDAPLQAIDENPFVSIATVSTVESAEKITFVPRPVGSLARNPSYLPSLDIAPGLRRREETDEYDHDKRGGDSEDVGSPPPPAPIASRKVSKRYSKTKKRGSKESGMNSRKSGRRDSDDDFSTPYLASPTSTFHTPALRDYDDRRRSHNTISPASALYDERRKSYQTVIPSSPTSPYIEIRIDGNMKPHRKHPNKIPITLHLKTNPFLTLLRRAYFLLLTKGSHNGENLYPDLNNLPAELKQRESFARSDTLVGAVARGSLVEFKKLKDRLKDEYFEEFGEHILDQTGPEGETLLHVALLMNSPSHDEIAEYLVHKRPHLINEVYEGANFTGEHCCHLLSVHNKLHLLKKFIRLGADVHNARATGKFFKPSGTLYFGETVLAFAACMGHFEIVRYLIEVVQVDPNIIDHQGNNVLHVLAFWGYYNDTRARHPDRDEYKIYKPHSNIGGIYLYLIEKGADESLANNIGMTPLQVAVARGHTEMVHALLNHKRETLWIFGKASSYLYDLSEVDTFVDPITMNHTKGALEIAITQKNRDVLNLPLFQRLLEAKWISYGRGMFYFTVLRNISYYCLFTAVIYLIPNGADYYQSEVADASRIEYFSTKIGILRLGLEGALLLCNAVTLVEEFSQMKQLKWDYFFGASAMESRFQWVNMVLIACVVISRVAVRSDFENVFLGLHAVVGWISLLNLTVGFRHMGTLWLIFMKVVTGDLFRFIILLVVFLLGFGEALWLQMAPYANHHIEQNTNATTGEVSEDLNRGVADWKSLPLAFLWSFRILMQQGVYDDYRQPRNNWLAILLFMTLFFILLVLLLNVFLAMLNQTFSKIMEDTEKQWRVIWAQLILSYDEALLSSYYNNLRTAKNAPPIPVSRIGFPKEIENFLNNERQMTLFLQRRLGNAHVPLLKRLMGNRGEDMMVHMGKFYSYCIIFEFREDNELPIRMIASTNLSSPLSGKWQVTSFSEKPWDKELLSKLDNDYDEPRRSPRKKGHAPKKDRRGRSSSAQSAGRTWPR